MLLFDKSKFLGQVAFELLGVAVDPAQIFFSLAVVEEGKIQAILVWTDYRPLHDVWWTIISFDKRWCTRRNLRVFFRMAFDDLKLKCVRAMTKVHNQQANSLLTRLGFENEGCLKAFYKTNTKNGPVYDDGVVYVKVARPPVR